MRNETGDDIGMSKGMKSVIFRRRRGVALVLALLVILIGSSVAAMIYDTSFNFSLQGQLQKEIYVDHTTVLDTVQTVKGFIISTNSSDTKAMHTPNYVYSDDASTISSVRALRLGPASIPDSPLSLSCDIVVSNGTGPQHLEVSVYDLCYKTGDLEASVRNDGDQMMELPPPFMMKGVTGGVGGVVSTGDTLVVGDLAAPLDDPAGELDMEKYGAYLIRVRLRDAGRRQIRMAEEAFVQVLP
ncbi:MAG: hypothetical protein LBT65_09625 [Synergistaceae bacterium]|jgi:hypothetical protein|nr:hypothetical protein [Synergistaceae bacterium]